MTDRFRGAIFGCAIAEALALPCEGGNPDILSGRYSEKPLALPHARPARDFPLNDWSANTDSVIYTMQALAEDVLAYMSRGQQAPPVEMRLAQKIVTWVKSGFGEMGDASGLGADALVQLVSDHPVFLTDPFKAARETIGPKTSNGALFRMIPIAAADTPENIAVRVSLVTHADTRSIASCVYFAILLRSLVLGFQPSPDLVQYPLTTAVQYLHTPPKEFIGFLSRGTVGSLELGARDSAQHVYKTLSAGMWGFRRAMRAIAANITGKGDKSPADAFKQCVTEIALQGGSACANAGAAGAVFGAIIGHSRLPVDWVQAIPYVSFLESQTAGYIHALDLDGSRPPPPESSGPTTTPFYPPE